MTQVEKIKMAIWMLNRMIDLTPQLYSAWKIIYIKQHSNKNLEQG